MAFSRWLCRRKKSICLVVFVSFVWFAYFSYLDERITEVKEKKKTHNKENDKKSTTTTTSASRLYFDNKDSVLEAPKLAPSDDMQQQQLEDKGKAGEKSKKASSPQNKDAGLSKTTAQAKEKGHIDQILNKIKDKTIEIGQKLKNKSMVAGERVKNKTIEHLKVLGMIKPKNKTSYLFYPNQFNLSISFDDIGDILKDTDNFNKVQPLDMNGPVLSSSQNRTANYTYNMDYHTGFCDCWERHCQCCARVAHKRLHLNSTMCSNFTFISKTHELDLQVLLDGKVMHKNILSADDPPLLCLGSIPKVTDICIHFFNVTFKVNAQDNHKTQLLGCTDFSLKLYNKTIGAHPVDCFQIPGDPNHKHQDEPFNLFGNWMP